MQTPTSTRWRILRGGVFALVATQLAALGHVMGGGYLPDPVVLLTVGIFLGGSLSGLATRRRRGPEIFLLLVASQLAFHGVFQLTAHHDGPIDAGRMVAFHVSAALAASWLMAGGESMLFRLFAAFCRAVLRARRGRAVELTPTWTAVISGGAGRLRRLAGDLSLPSRRGPPVAA